MAVALLACLLLLGTAATPASVEDVAPAPATSPLRVEVVDADGDPVPGAQVFALPGEDYTAAYRRVMEAQDRDPVSYQVIEECGQRQTTDAHGVVLVEGGAAGIHLVARAPGRYASVFSDAKLDALQVALQPDRELVLGAVDTSGAPTAGVEVVIAPARLYGPGGCKWIGVTGDDGTVRLPHAQCIVTGDEQLYASLGIPVAERERMRLSPSGLPEEPIVFRLPPTGRVVVEGPQESAGHLRIRRDPESFAGSDRFWSSYAPNTKRPRAGRAEFPHVEVGLQLEAQAWWPGSPQSCRVVGPGPTAAGETITIRIQTPEWFAAVRDGTRAVVAENGVEIPVSWTALTATRSDNSEFALCFQPLDRSTQLGMSPVVRIGSWEPTTTGAHAGPDGSLHPYAVVSSRRVDRVAAATQLPIARYVCREPMLGARFETNRATYAPDDEVVVTLTIENLGPATIRWLNDGKRKSAHPRSRFRFVGRFGTKKLRWVQSPGVYGYTASIGGQHALLAPGQRITQEAVLSSWFPFENPGTYEITASFDLSIFEPVPEYSTATFCPAAAGDCVEVIAGEFDVIVE